MFNKINFQNLLRKGKVSSNLLDTDYIGLMKHNEKSNGDFEESVISGKNLKSEISTIVNSAVVEITGEQTQYAEATIDTGSIAIMHSVEQVILPPPPSGSYHIIKDIVVEYTHVTFPYTVAGGTYLRIYFGTLEGINTPQWFVEAQTLLEQSSNRVANPEQAGLENTVDAVVRDTHSAQSIAAIETALHAKLTTGVTDGDGTLRFKVWYETRAFGTEL